MKISIIGFGTMGRMFATLILRVPSPQTSLTIANRTLNRMEDFVRDNPHVAQTDDFAEAVMDADIVFLCVSPAASKEVLERINSSLKTTCILVSFVSDLSIANIERHFSGKIMHLVPTITSYIDRGVTVVSMNAKATHDDLELIANLVSPQLKCSVVGDNEINDYSIITSCGPGIVSSMLTELSNSLAHGSTLDQTLVSAMVTETVAAVCEYAATTGKSFPRILSEVATKGGITESGASVITEKAGCVFLEMAERMKARHTERTEKINALYE